eukprot:1187097-Prorocentrum_minimum.AAC.2
MEEDEKPVKRQTRSRRVSWVNMRLLDAPYLRAERAVLLREHDGGPQQQAGVRVGRLPVDAKQLLCQHAH